MSFICFPPVANRGVPDLFRPSRFRVLQDEGRLAAIKKVLIQLSRRMLASVMKGDLLKIISDCDVKPVAALLAFARAKGIDGKDLKALGRYFCYFAATMVVAVPE